MLRHEPPPRGQRPRPLGHVVVATDFSPGASWAVARAGRLPLVKGARVTILHVLPEELPIEVAAFAEDAARRGLDAAATEIERLLAAANAQAVVSSELRRGRPHLEIAKQARDGADLLVLGRHGQRGLKAVLIGSTAERVVRLAVSPTLVIGARPKRTYRRPLVATDLGGGSEALAAAAVRLTAAEVTSAILMHAYDVPFGGFIAAGVSRDQMAELREGYRQAAAAELAALATSLSHLGIGWDGRLLRGDPRTAIVDEAIDLGADLIAVGTGHQAGLSRALLGSVTERVLRSAERDVLVVPTARPSRARP